MPYGSCGVGVNSSLNGISFVPYLAIEEQNMILLTLFSIAALNNDTDPVTIFCVIRWGEKTDKPSYAVAAVWYTKSHPLVILSIEFRKQQSYW